MPRLRLASTIALLTTTAGLAAVAGPALGANARPFDLFAGTDKTAGNAHAYGTVEFDRRESAYVQGHINDICPKDGRGAYLEVWATFGPKGSQNGRFISQRVVKDASTCGGEGHDFAFRTKEHNGRRINGVHFRLRECDMDHGLCDGDFTTQDVDRG